MGSVERIKNVARRVAKWKAKGTTRGGFGNVRRDQSADRARQGIQPHPIRASSMWSPRPANRSPSPAGMALMEMGLRRAPYTGGQVCVLTDNAFNKARILRSTRRASAATSGYGYVVVSPVFRSGCARQHYNARPRRFGYVRGGACRRTEGQGVPDLHGRGRCVPTDPRVVPRQRLKKITFEEMLEMGSLGSKVLRSAPVEFAGNILRCGCACCRA